MKYSAFEALMKKSAFSFREALLTTRENAQGLRLNLHRWVKAGHLQRIRREVYAFPGRHCSLPERILALYAPAYISMETALNQHGLVPDVPFETTLVTTRPPRSFQTPWGRFHFHHIQTGLFFGYDSSRLLAEPEKALLDYFYLRGHSLKTEKSFWREARFQNLKGLDWKRGDKLVKPYPGSRVLALWESLKDYAKTA